MTKRTLLVTREQLEAAAAAYPDRYTLDASDWPLIVNDDDDDGRVVVTFPEPAADADERVVLQRVAQAKAIVHLLNRWAENEKADAATNAVLSRATKVKR